MGQLRDAAQQQGGDGGGDDTGEGTTDALATQPNIRLHAGSGGRGTGGREPGGMVAALRFALPTLTLAWFDSWLRGEGRAYGDGRPEPELFAQFVLGALWRDFQAQPELDDGSPVYDTEAWALEFFTAMLQPAEEAAEGGTRREVRVATIKDCCEAMMAMAEQGMPADEIAKRLPALLGGA